MKGREVCEELSVLFTDEMEWTVFWDVWVRGRKYELWWSGKEMELVMWELL